MPDSTPLPITTEWLNAARNAELQCQSVCDRLEVTSGPRKVQLRARVAPLRHALGGIRADLYAAMQRRADITTFLELGTEAGNILTALNAEIDQAGGGGA